MININLTTKEKNTEEGSLGREWGVFLLVVIVAVLIYLGVFIYNRRLNQNLEEKNKEYEAKHDSLLEKGKSVFDFQNRLETAKFLIAEKNYALESLGQIERAIIPEVYIESFNFNSEKGQIDLNCVTQRYRLMANQIASFKKMDYFSKVAITGKTSTREDGKIEFLLKLTIRDN